MIRSILAAVAFAIAIFAYLTEVVGLFRFKYVLTRVHAAALGDTFGIGFIVLGSIILKGFSLAAIKLLLILIFMFLTGPVLTHLVGRAELLYQDKKGIEYEEERRL